MNYQNFGTAMPCDSFIKLRAKDSMNEATIKRDASIKSIHKTEMEMSGIIFATKYLNNFVYV